MTESARPSAVATTPAAPLTSTGRDTSANFADTPWDPSVVKRYTERRQTLYDHA
ncbi:hypothetical protein [Streptomyces niveus]|uniref:hypothetical protein n=1 Tax=Streptomyces niveus TaxID=193462 RepID=UPI0003C61F2E|nr:hypothetical protein [Streptomyces niveus]EST33861.1 hypothetical protein M877_00995 [Streptomyces niveus NCIMB 11891]